MAIHATKTMVPEVVSIERGPCSVCCCPRQSCHAKHAGHALHSHDRPAWLACSPCKVQCVNCGRVHWCSAHCSSVQCCKTQLFLGRETAHPWRHVATIQLPH